MRLQTGMTPDFANDRVRMSEVLESTGKHNKDVRSVYECLGQGLKEEGVEDIF
jgi:hypothetical protein